MLCHNEEDGEEKDEDMTAGDLTDANTTTSGETVDGTQMVNNKFINAQGGMFFLFLFFFLSERHLLMLMFKDVMKQGAGVQRKKLTLVNGYLPSKIQA